jgi:hypothetical protein
MKKTGFVYVIFFISILLIAFSNLSLAQGNQPPGESFNDTRLDRSIVYDYFPPEPSDLSAEPLLSTVTRDRDTSLNPSITLGEPGFSMRYVETYGETGVAYPDDTSHINIPFGIGV